MRRTSFVLLGLFLSIPLAPAAEKSGDADRLVLALLAPSSDVRVSAFLSIRESKTFPKPLFEKARDALPTLLSRFDDPKSPWDSQKAALFVELATYAEYFKNFDVLEQAAKKLLARPDESFQVGGPMGCEDAVGHTRPYADYSLATAQAGKKQFTEAAQSYLAYLSAPLNSDFGCWGSDWIWSYIPQSLRGIAENIDRLAPATRSDLIRKTTKAIPGGALQAYFLTVLGEASLAEGRNSDAQNYFERVFLEFPSEVLGPRPEEMLDLDTSHRAVVELGQEEDAMFESVALVSAKALNGYLKLVTEKKIDPASLMGRMEKKLKKASPDEVHALHFLLARILETIGQKEKALREFALVETSLKGKPAGCDLCKIAHQRLAERNPALAKPAKP